MNTKFSDLGIKPNISHFTGDKIKISKVLNREITILDFSIKPSNYKGDFLQLQIELEGVKYVIFTGSTVLIDLISKVPKSSFPLDTTIIEENEHYEFT